MEGAAHRLETVLEEMDGIICWDSCVNLRERICVFIVNLVYRCGAPFPIERSTNSMVAPLGVREID